MADFGLSKQINDDEISVTNTASCTELWAAPEVLTGIGRVTVKLDIYCLGCIYYYLWTNEHPFGPNNVRRSNIMNDNITDLSNELLGKYELQKLISEMVQIDQDERLSAEAVSKHPFFWKGEEKINFISRIKELVSNTDDENGQVILSYLTSNKNDVLQCDDWIHKLEPIMQKHLCEKEKGIQKRTYNNSFVDLMQCIRNKYEHIAELPSEIQVLFRNFM